MSPASAQGSRRRWPGKQRTAGRQRRARRRAARCAWNCLLVCWYANAASFAPPPARRQASRTISTMRITVCCTDTKTAPWIEGLRAALPDATVEEWHPGAPQADHAVVWAPPQAFLDEQPALKGLF